jgi:hypothetical protein
MVNETSVRNVWSEPIYETLEIPEYIKMSAGWSNHGNQDMSTDARHNEQEIDGTSQYGRRASVNGDTGHGGQ